MSSANVCLLFLNPIIAADTTLMSAETHQIILVEQPGKTSIRISAEICKNGDLQLSGQDIGKIPLEIFGDHDHEYWLTVPAAQKDLLLLALLEALYKGDACAISKLREMLVAKKIPCEFFSQ
ncbi:MAG TPA: hypothetical protein VK785_04070 [Opitutaceae bacterium]|nr:hypothetical protein [Opitutaceae bacterium]